MQKGAKDLYAKEYHLSNGQGSVRGGCSEILSQLIEEGTDEDVAEEHIHHQKRKVLDSSVFLDFGVGNMAFELGQPQEQIGNYQQEELQYCSW